MAILTKKALDFAKQNISSFYDTDFFPKPFEFDAIWHCWDEVVKELTARNVGKMSFSPPRAAPAKKPKGGYRIVHQLEPLDAIVYTALVYQVAQDIERARMPEDNNVACAYRISIDEDEGSFFSAGSGYETFRRQSTHLARQNRYVLQTDISDFYNQVYLHRLNNAIEHANPKLKAIANDIEHFLLDLNGRASQGVPVGPPASIVMAEATLIDVDQFIANEGLPHTRYVDDFRIYAKSREKLELSLQRLTQYLYESHRLTLSTEKTRITGTKDFIKDELNNQYEIEKFEVFEEIEDLNPYTDERELIVKIDSDAARPVVMDALKGLFKRGPLDLGLARALIRQARAATLTEPAELIIKYFDFFLPVANTVFVYLNDITDAAFLRKARNAFARLSNSPAMENPIVRVWFEWYLTLHREYLENKVLRKFLYDSPNLIAQARAVVLEKNLAWVRQKKAQIQNLGSWDRRALLYASQVLPSDEKKHWINQVRLASAHPLDRWVCDWIVEMDSWDEAL